MGKTTMPITMYLCEFCMTNTHSLLRSEDLEQLRSTTVEWVHYYQPEATLLMATLPQHFPQAGHKPCGMHACLAGTYPLIPYPVTTLVRHLP